MYQSTDIVKRETLTAMVGTYNQSIQQIEQAYNLLDAAKTNLKAAFVNDNFYVTSGNHYGLLKDDLAKVLLEVKRRAWKSIVDRLELKKILSIKRREELDKQLDGETRHCGDELPPLPEITEENIVAMYQDNMAKSVDYAREAVNEVFDWLRPFSGHNSELKTNSKWKIGKKVIVYAIEKGYGINPFRVSYYRDKNVTALDNVFHMLDGRGGLKTHHGPLYDAINGSADGTGETEYFRFKCHKNGNLHIDFKRVDLVNKINKMAGSSNSLPNN